MGFCFLYTCCMQSIVFHSVWWWLWNKVENLQSHLLVLFCSYFELQDVLILRILFLFILTHLTPSFSSLLMLIHNSKSRNNSPCFKVTSLYLILALQVFRRQHANAKSSTRERTEGQTVGRTGINYDFLTVIHSTENQTWEYMFYKSQNTLKSFLIGVWFMVMYLSMDCWERQ